MKNSKLITIFLFLILVIALIFLIPKSDNKIISTIGLSKNQVSPDPEVSNYNPPKEIKYDASTDLKQELEKIDPKVLNSDFDPLKSL